MLTPQRKALLFDQNRAVHPFGRLHTTRRTALRCGGGTCRPCPNRRDGWAVCSEYHIWDGGGRVLAVVDAPDFGSAPHGRAARRLH